MKQYKLLLSVLFVTVISFTSVAQKNSTMTADQALEKLTKEITTGDPSAELTKQQKKDFIKAYDKN